MGNAEEFKLSFSIDDLSESSVSSDFDNDLMTPIKQSDDLESSSSVWTHSPEIDKSDMGKPKNTLHKTISLKSILKRANERFVDRIEDQYFSETPKTSQAAITLAKLYIEGKRVTKDLNKAYEILKNSLLIESKYLLLKLSAKNGLYADAFYYNNFLWVSQCTCDENYLAKKIAKLDKTATKSPVLKKLSYYKATCQTKGHLSECFKHKSEVILKQIVDLIGETKAKVYQKQGNDSNHTLHDFSKKVEIIN